jgi:hypothetical protein
MKLKKTLLHLLYSYQNFNSPKGGDEIEERC